MGAVWAVGGEGKIVAVPVLLGKSPLVFCCGRKPSSFVSAGKNLCQKENRFVIVLDARS